MVSMPKHTHGLSSASPDGYYLSCTRGRVRSHIDDSISLIAADERRATDRVRKRWCACSSNSMAQWLRCARMKELVEASFESKDACMSMTVQLCRGVWLKLWACGGCSDACRIFQVFVDLVRHVRWIRASGMAPTSASR
jgi:hypothetical protein